MSRKFVKILALLMTICVSAAMSSCTNGESTDETAANVSSEESVESVGSDIEKSSRVKTSDIISSSENSEDISEVSVDTSSEPLPEKSDYVVSQVSQSVSDTVSTDKTGDSQLSKNTDVSNNTTLDQHVGGESEISENITEREALENYVSSMQTEGEIVEDYFSTQGISAKWNVNKYKIDDFNCDGSDELIIQYYCGIDVNGRSAEKQGVAIKIVKFEDGQIKEYSNFNSFNNYIRTAGADVGTDSEITEEPYVDSDGNIGIFTSRAIMSSCTGLYYCTSVINNGVLVNQGGFGSVIMYGMLGHYGHEDQPSDAPYYFEITPDNSFNHAYLFMELENIMDSNNNYIDYSEAKEKFESTENINRISDFAINSESVPIILRQNYFNFDQLCFYMD